MNTLSALVLAATSLLSSPAFAEERVLTSFDGTDSLRWQTVNDGVMGGRSKGAPALTKSDTLRFDGEISLKNNGGFSSIRTRAQDLQLGDYDGLKLRIRGDGRDYKLSLRTSGSSGWIAYWADFETKRDEWTTVEIPFSEWVPTSFGRKLNGPRLLPSGINSVGFMLYDKKSGPFSLEVDSIVAFKGKTPEGADSTKSGTTIVSAAKAAGSFKTLLAAAEAAGLVDALSGPGPLTVFAPSDAAFAQLPAGTVENLLKPENRDSLRTVLLHHVVSGDISLPALLRSPKLTTLAGQRLQVSSQEGELKLGGAKIATSGLRCDNGVIHVVDRVMLPELRDLATIADSTGTFQTLVAAAEAADLLDTLTGVTELTVFAPTDAAFEALPEGTVAQLLKPESSAELKRILLHHVVLGRVYADSAAAAGTTKSLAETELSFAYAGGLKVNGSRIIGRDISASNGVIHVIGTVLLPPELEVATIARVSEEDGASRAVRVVTSAIQAGAPLFNDGQQEACCTVYELATTALLGLEEGLFSPRVTKRLKEALDSKEEPSKKAWTLRRAIDSAYREVRSSR